jgi:DNA-binding MarR family transcriptional regulator
MVTTLPRSAAQPTQEQDARAAAAHLLHRISRELREPQTQDWLTLELTMAQLKILFYAYYRGPATVGQIAEALGVSLPTASGTIDKLVKLGMVERFDDPNDRRLVMNKTTAKGGAFVERLRDVRRARVNQALEKLTADEVESLVLGLRVLASALGIQDREGDKSKERPYVDATATAKNGAAMSIPTTARTKQA